MLEFNDLWWRVELDGCPQIEKSLLNTLGRFLMRKLGNGEVNEIVSSEDAIVDMIPQLVPEHGAGKWIRDFIEVKLKRSECVVIESNFGVGVITMVNLISGDWRRDVQLNIVELL